jgi:hypothetical protein
MGKKSGSGSGTYNRIRISESFETIFGLKYLFFDADPGRKRFGSGIGDDKISDPESGIKTPSRIRNTVKITNS